MHPLFNICIIYVKCKGMYTFTGTWKIIYLDLALFSESSAFITYSIVLSCVLSKKYVKVINNVVSSAYIIHVNMLLACEK